MDNIERAMQFAFDAHIAQKRKSSGIPYVTHCVEVFKRVSDWGITDEDILIAALLHDVQEDCPHKAGLVVKDFGPKVATIMMECSRPERDDATKAEKFAFLMSFYNKSTESVVIKIADRYCNVNDYLRTAGKQEYASTYALQAYPLYDSFTKRVKERKVNLDSDIQKKILMDIMDLQSIASRVYPRYDRLSPDDVKRFVVEE